MTLSPEILARKNILTNIFRLVGILICIGFMWRQQGIAIFPIRLADVVCIGPIIAAIFFKPIGRTFWFLWGIALGGFLILVAGGAPLTR